MPRSPHLARFINAFASLGMNDVGEDGSVVFAYFDADGAGAVGGERIDQVAELRPSPFTVRTWGRELAAIADDAHGTALVDADAGDRKMDGRFGRGFPSAAVTHVSQVCQRTPGPRIPVRSASTFGTRPRGLPQMQHLSYSYSSWIKLKQPEVACPSK